MSYLHIIFTCYRLATTSSTCNNFRYPSQYGTITIAVKVKDVNEFAPEFTETEYEATIAENSPVGTLVIQVIYLLYILFTQVIYLLYVLANQVIYLLYVLVTRVIYLLYIY